MADAPATCWCEQQRTPTTVSNRHDHRILAEKMSHSQARVQTEKASQAETSGASR